MRTNAEKKPVHPYRKTATQQIVFGAIFGAIGGATLALGGLATAPLGAAMILLGGFFGWIGLFSRRQTDAVLFNNAAFDLVSRGRIAEAEALLDAVPLKSGNIRRAVEVQRAMIALRRADAKKAEKHAEAAMVAGRGFWTADAEKAQECVAQAIRAIARASMGEEAVALEDVRSVRASDASTTEALGRAAVAEAIVLAKKDDRDALAKCLRSAAPLLDYIAPRERALLRAFRRMIEVRAGSVYREPGRQAEPDREEPMLGEWVAQIVPQAAAFVPEAERRPETNALETGVPESFAVRAGSESISRQSKKQVPVKRVLALWVVLIVMFLTIWQFLSPADHRAPAPEPLPEPQAAGALPLTLVSFAVFAVFSLLIARIAFAIRRARRNAVSLRDAMRDLATADVERATSKLNALVKTGDDSSAASALLSLAVLAERGCRMKDSLAACDAGIARISRNAAVRAANSDLLVPELIGQRAFVLAALGRDQEASAELATLGREHPTFAYLTRAVFRVRLAQALRGRQLSAAVDVARERTPELPLSRRDELLADIVLAISGGKLVEGEIERIASELREDKELATWIDFMAPGAREQLAARATRVRVEAAHEPEEILAPAEATREALS